MSKGFPQAAARALRDAQLRRNLHVATRTIREKRAAAVAEVPDWEELRERGRTIRDRLSPTSTSCSRCSSARSPLAAATSTGPATLGGERDRRRDRP